MIIHNIFILYLLEIMLHWPHDFKGIGNILYSSKTSMSSKSNYDFVLQKFNFQHLQTI